ncbi:MAG: universal stress protein [Deltaproteobacteria bacterium]|nr:universal stress protein [Deltaproteobacteria bacterium]
MTTETSHVVVGYDFTASADEALKRAIGVGARAPWHVLHFVCVLTRGTIADADAVEERLTETIREVFAAAEIEGRVSFFVHVHIGRPAEEILRVAKDVGADLIIVGQGEHGRLRSVAEKVVHEAGCTVEVARDKAYAYVPLLEVVEKEKDPGYVTPHRYTYEDARVTLRPRDWPLY